MDLQNAIQTAAPFTANFESFSSNPYFDVNGYAIGYGNHYYMDGSTVDSTDDPISQTDALNLLAFYLNQVGNTIQGFLTVDVSDNMLAALIDLGYNWGTAGVGGSQLLQLINQGADPATITAQWNKTAITSGGVLNQDLVNRRAKESALAFSGAYGALDVTTLAIAGVFILGFIYFATKKG
jgi:lysozyme